MSEKKKRKTENQQDAMMPLNTGDLAKTDGSIDESALYERIAAIIENRKARAAAYANSEI